MDKSQIDALKWDYYACGWCRRVFERRTHKPADLDFRLFHEHEMCPGCKQSRDEERKRTIRDREKNLIDTRKKIRRESKILYR